MAKIDTDPLREVDDRLIKWGKWRNEQERLLQPIKPSVVNRMAGEMAEARRQGKSPRQISQAAYACMIHGEGYKPEAHYDDMEEWETQEALDRMPSTMDQVKAVLDIEYRRWETQKQKARILSKKLTDKMSLKRYQDYKRVVLHWLQAYFEGKNTAKIA